MQRAESASLPLRWNGYYVLQSS